MSTEFKRAETEQDISDETFVLSAIEQYMMELPIGTVVVKQTEKRAMTPHDADVFINNMYTGIIEVKTTSWSYEDLNKANGGMMVELDTLQKLKPLGWVDGHGWTKRIVLAYYLKNDQRLFMVSMPKLRSNWARMKPVPAGKVTDDHGKTPTNREAYYVPFDLWTEVPLR